MKTGSGDTMDERAFAAVSGPEVGSERLARILERVSDGYSVLDDEWRFSHLSSGAARLLGRSREELAGRSIWGIFPEAIALPFYSAAQRAVSERVSVHVVAYFPSSDKWLASDLFPDEGGLWVFFRDVTERRRAEESLQALRNELAVQLADMRHLHELTVRLSGSSGLSAVLNEVLTAVTALQHTDMGAAVLFDREQGLLYTVASVGLSEEYVDRLGPMPVGARASGLAIRERRGVIVEDVEKEPAFAPYLDAARLAGYRAAYGTPLLTSRGEIVGALATYFREPHSPSERDVFLVELYARLAAGLVEHARLYDEAQEAVHLRDEIIEGLSRDLRDPLAQIRSDVRGLRRQLAEAPSAEIHQIAEKLAAVDSLAARASGRLSEILDVASLDLGQPLQLDRRPTDLVALAREAVDEHARGSPGHQLRLEATVPELAGLWDPERLQRMLAVLLTNAVRATPDGGSIEVSIHRQTPDRQTTPTGDLAVLVVRDRGLGIPAAELPHVFDRPRPTTRSAAESGVEATGLAGVKEVVRQHGGDIAVMSEGGLGSAFTIRLPLAPPDQSDDARSPRADQPSASAHSERWDEPSRARLLTGLPVFRTLPPSALRVTAAASRVRPIKRGEFVFLEGEPVGALNVLVEGRVKIVRETAGWREVIIRVVGPGEVFGFVGAGTESAHRVSALVQQRGLVLQVPKGHLTSLLRSYPSFTRAMLQLVGSHLWAVESRVRDLQTEDAERRTARVLLWLAAKERERSAPKGPASLALSRQDLAELAGTNSGTASRTLSAWSKLGIVAALRKRVVILDLPALQEVAEGADPIRGQATG